MSTFGKLLKGALKFREVTKSNMVKRLNDCKLSGHHASAVMYACMDARIKPLSLVNAELGDIYIVRNAGNMIPFGGCQHEVSAVAEPAGLDLTVKLGKIKHVIVCGHSDCAAMKGLYGLHQNPGSFDMNSPLHHWLEQRGNQSIERLEKRLKNGPQYKLQFAKNCQQFSFQAMIDPEEKYNVLDKLSQINTLQQVENITSQNFLAENFAKQKVNLHAFWFELETGDMLVFSKTKERYVVIDSKNVNELIEEGEL
uniref:Carbonic anhydrase n=1 Tax=Syphacia muris TaxID=451379 RepID=A0A0N5AQS5_9BILA